MRDQEFKVEEIEVSYTLGGVGEGRVQGREKSHPGEGVETTLSYTLQSIGLSH